jgi:hypothetical protein
VIAAKTARTDACTLHKSLHAVAVIDYLALSAIYGCELFIALATGVNIKNTNVA